MIKPILAAGFLFVAAAAFARGTTFDDVSSSGASAAASQAAPASGEEKTVRDALATLAPKAKAEAVAKSELPGFYEVVVDNGQVVYISADGKYLIQGDVIDLAQKASLTSRAQASLRLAALKNLPQSKRLVFAPANPKHTVTVFTDVDCPYCRQFHKQIAAYNQVGIAVEYVFFPLSIHPGADKKAEAVWCSQDRNAAYTAAMNGQDPGKKTCPNPIAETTALGMKLGIGGTPTILNEKGVQVNGGVVQDPNKFLAELDRLAALDAKGPVAAK
ncbi:MAG: DsbC family protein [Rudaea sp.]|uniref:DsbC family protein n=1 Tax=Rudaea sp. TaxID=2136325 RepID=UPI0039E6B07A